MKEVNNHPVHILNKNGSFSPSAFIPFCSFGENLLLVGTKIDEIEFPICNIFVPKVLNNQLCYEADLAKSKENSNIVNQYEMGLVLIIDYNEDRQFILDPEKRKREGKKFHRQKTNLITGKARSPFTITFDTISKSHIHFEQIAL